MPVTVTFDVEGAPAGEHNYVQSLFQRFGWEHLGGTAYRYPKLGAKQPTEDWFNHVIPALMLLRAYGLMVQSKGRKIKVFTIDAYSSTGFNPTPSFGKSYGTPPMTGAKMTLYKPTIQAFGKKNLISWIDAATWPY